MFRWTSIAVLSLVVAAGADAAERVSEISAKGIYVEARTCDVWTGPCFANAEFNIAGTNGVMAWRIDKGQAGDVSLDGLSVVAVIKAGNTLGLEQSAPPKAVLIVDSKASAAQRDALVKFAQQQGGMLLKNISAVHCEPINLNGCPCKENACFELDARVAKLKTRCLNADHDKVCGNEFAFYPPLVSNVKAGPAAVVEHTYHGAGLGETWSDDNRRGAYVGSFDVR